jgi:thiamine pyrophosphate-dependent acetolactate synthase large subunit-like protein
VAKWWKQIEEWRAIDCLKFEQKGKTMKPQYALSRLEALTKKYDRYICTEVGQHQMWAAQYLGFEDPNRWMTSGGLGTMGYASTLSGTSVSAVGVLPSLKMCAAESTFQRFLVFSFVAKAP